MCRHSSHLYHITLCGHRSLPHSQTISLSLPRSLSYTQTHTHTHVSAAASLLVSPLNICDMSPADTPLDEDSLIDRCSHVVTVTAAEPRGRTQWWGGGGSEGREKVNRQVTMSCLYHLSPPVSPFLSSPLLSFPLPLPLLSSPTSPSRGELFNSMTVLCHSVSVLGGCRDPVNCQIQAKLNLFCCRVGRRRRSRCEMSSDRRHVCVNTHTCLISEGRDFFFFSSFLCFNNNGYPLTPISTPPPHQVCFNT